MTKKALELGDGDIFKTLLTAYIETFNWAYEDGYSELPIIKEAGLFSLADLHKRGNKSVLLSDFTEDFVNVFPAALNEVDDDRYTPPFEEVCACYRLRTTERLWAFFGFVTLYNNELLSKDDIASMERTELFDKAFSFNG